MNMTKVAIVVLNRNGKNLTLDCLTSLEDLTSPKDVEIVKVVVDNGSTDDSVASIKEEFPGVVVLQTSANLGFAEGNNVGFRYSLKKGADFVIVLNNDTIADQALVEAFLETAQRVKTGIIAPKIYFAPGYEFHKDRYQQEQRGKVIWYAGGLVDWKNVIASHRGVDEVDSGQYDQVQETDFASGCCFLVPREIFEKIGFFDKRYFLYWEDNDFSQRAKKAGFKIFYAPKARLWHLNAGTAGGSGSSLQEYFITRNRLLFGLKFAPLRAKIALLRQSISLLLKGNKWQRQGVLDFYLGRVGKGSYPL